MSIDQAIETYVDFVSKVFSARQTGLDWKFNTRIFEEIVKDIVKGATGDSNEPILEQRSGACKV